MFTFPINDFILINKPAGWTSFDVVGFIRKQIRITHPELKNIKVGHAGTLDPFATGLLIVAIGRDFTKRLDEFKKMPKTYVATIRLGATSDTQDRTGQVTPTGAQEVSREQIEKEIRTFLGPQLQLPPMFSAKKINGQRLYELARQGKEVERQPVPVEVYSIWIEEYAWPMLKIRVQCSAGTYIRTLAHDLGQKLGTGALCDELVRTAIGEFQLKNAQNLA